MPQESISRPALIGQTEFCLSKWLSTLNYHDILIWSSYRFSFQLKGMIITTCPSPTRSLFWFTNTVFKPQAFITFNILSPSLSLFLSLSLSLTLYLSLCLSFLPLRLFLFHKILTLLLYRRCFGFWNVEVIIPHGNATLWGINTVRFIWSSLGPVS